jgi:hypothetical protein
MSRTNWHSDAADFLCARRANKARSAAAAQPCTERRFFVSVRAEPDGYMIRERRKKSRAPLRLQGRIGRTDSGRARALARADFLHALELRSSRLLFRPDLAPPVGAKRFRWSPFQGAGRRLSSRPLPGANRSGARARRPGCAHCVD